MTFLIQQTLLYAVPLMIVALAGVFAERSGIINLALEGIMIFGAFVGVLFVQLMQQSGAFDGAKADGNWLALQGLMLLAMLVTAAAGTLFSLLLSFASVNLRADQTIGGTALNLLAPALVLFLIRIIANQNTLYIDGDAASWFMIRKSDLGFSRSDNLGFLGETHQVLLRIVKHSGFPIVDEHRTLPIPPITSNKTVFVECMKLPAHAVQALVRPDHDGLGGGESISRGQLPPESKGIDAQHHPQDIVIVHLCLR